MLIPRWFQLLVLGWAAGSPAGLGAQPRLRIAVLDLSGTALMVQTTATPVGNTTTVPLPAPADFARGLTQILTTALVGHPELVVLERSVLDRVLGEQDFSASGRVTAESATQLGKVLGAQALITGDITEFSYQQSSVGSKVSLLKEVNRQIGAKLDRVTAQVALDLRIVDAVTGEVIGSVRGEGKASATGVGADFEGTSQSIAVGGSVQTPLGQASRQAVERSVAGLVTKLRATPWTGRIADVRNGRVYINAGTSAGLRVGMQFEVFRQDEALTDPDTGAALGAPEQRAGRISLTQITAKYAVARVLEGTGFKRNDVVRFLAAGGAP